MPSACYGARGLTVARGAGDRLWDTEGREYVDFLAGHGAALFGHAHPEPVAVLRDAAASPWTLGAGLSHPARSRLVALLDGLLPEGCSFLSNSGAEAVEAALKLVLALRPGRKRLLALRRSFHGRTLGALGLTFNPKYRKPWQDQLCAVEHRTPEALLEAVGEDVAAVFVEPIQGEGGVYLLDPAFGAALSVRCRQTGTLLVADEIQCGWGRCGAVLASVEAGISPDVVCLAKGVAGGFPVGVTVWRGALGDFPPRGHGSTYGGNPLACALGVATWELLHRENLFRWARETGRMFREQLAALDAPGVTEVRGQGLLVGVEIDGDAEVVVRELQRRGVLALPAGPRVVRFLPPFGASPESFSRVAEVLGEALREVPRGR